MIRPSGPRNALIPSQKLGPTKNSRSDRPTTRGVTMTIKTICWIIAFLTNTSESVEDRQKRDAPPSRYHDERQSGHLGVAKRPLAD